MYTISIFLFLIVTGSSNGGNLSCYQCTKTTNEHCGAESLQICPENKDRCVTHITKDAEKGFSIKRECGLGPCGFEDAMVNKGLGLDGCDRSKDEYFCVFCCKTSGCNKDSAAYMIPSMFVITACIILLYILCVYI